MAYKDKDGQREANRKAQAKFKAKAKGITSEGITEQGITEAIEDMADDFCGVPRRKRGKDIKCFLDLPLDVQHTIQMLSETEAEYHRRTAIAITYHQQHPDRYEPQGAVCTGVVTGKPGDADYNGICTKEWRAERGR